MKNESILCMPLTTWDSEFPNTIVQLMHVLSQENKILFVDYEYTVKDILTSLSGKNHVPVQRVLGIDERLREVKTKYGSSVYVLTPPPVLPINWIKWKNPYRVLLQLNSQVVKASVSKALKHLGMENPTVINGYNPFFGLPLAGAFDELLNIYFCYDEINGDEFYKFHGPQIEKDYVKKVDGVIVTSDGLLESKCPLHRNCYVVKNGVDFDLFNSVADFRPQNKVSVAGYTGSIDERFDTALMESVAKSLSDVQFVFIGRVTNQEAKRKLSQLPNISFAGGKRPEEVPQMLQNVDVCIIPYLKNELTRGVYPLKVNEYLAAGKPVVMTDFAELNDLKGHVRIAPGGENFANAIREELKGDNAESRKQRIIQAKENSWERKAEEFSEVVDTLRLKKFVFK